MNITMSISSRGLVYFPERLQKKLKLKRPGKFNLTLQKDNKVEVKPIRDIMEFAGKSKIKAPDGFDFRKFLEENYERR